MNLSKITAFLCTTLLLVIAFVSCQKKENKGNTPPATQPVEYNYNFRWREYPNAQSLVIFETTNVPEEATLMWHINGEVIAGKLKYVFPKGGTYEVKLVVNNDDAHSITKQVVIAPASVYTKYSGAQVVGDTIFFTSSGSDGGKHLWNFGDGTTSNVNDPYHVYANAGEYLVNLTVTELEDKPLTSALRFTIENDPVHTAKITKDRNWEITAIDFNLPAGTNVIHTPFNKQFAMQYVNKVTVGLKDGYLNGNIGYNGKASSGNLLVFTRGEGTVSKDTLIYDHVADTMWCRGTVWNLPAGSKFTNGTGTTYIMRAK